MKRHNVPLSWLYALFHVLFTTHALAVIPQYLLMIKLLILIHLSRHVTISEISCIPLKRVDIHVLEEKIIIFDIVHLLPMSLFRRTNLRLI